MLLSVSCSDGSQTEAPGVPEGSIRNISVAALVADMGVGINIGNTFDSLNTGNVAGETGWGNPKVSRDYIKALKGHGYTAIRLPVSWADYMGPAPGYVIGKQWMDRITEVVSWILEEDMYCVLNIHHDGGGDNSSDKYWIKRIATDEEGITARFTTVWKQIAEHFAPASDKLIFEAMNEVGFDSIWNQYSNNQAGKAEAYRLLNKLNQTFVDAVRSTGGNNTERALLVCGYWTDIDRTCDSFFQIPRDTAENRLAISVHYYTPSTFCIAEQLDNSWGFRDDWGTAESAENDTKVLNEKFDLLKTTFLDKGVPVIMGEYGVTKRNKNEAGRIRWMTAVTQICLDNGICPVLWDTGLRSNNQGMADIRRTAPFNMSEALTAVWQNIRLP